MAITDDPIEYIAALGDLTPLVNQPGGYQGTIDILNQFAGNKGSGSYNIPNGGFTMPITDPTYSSGLNYAQSIAGGQNVPNMIAPGVSYSAEQPGGYTQADLNGTPPPPPPVYQQPDDPSFFGTGIGGVTIPGGRRDKMPPLRNIFGNNPDVTGYQVPTEQPVQVPPQEFNIEQIVQDIADSGIDFTNLFGLPQAPDLSQFVTKDDLPTGRDFSIENLDLPDFNEFALRKDLPVYQEPDLSQFITKQELPSLIPEAPTGRDFSIENLDLPDFSEFALRKDLPVYKEPDLSGFARIEDLPTFNPDELRQDILMSLPEQKMQDLSGFMTQDDINKAIAGIDIPTYQAPDLSAYDTRLAELEQSLAALQQPTGNSFSINQPQVRGLF